MKVLGVSVAHDSGVCVYENGKILSFYKEERLSRRKRDSLPILSLSRALEDSGDNIDAIVFCPVVANESFTINYTLNTLDKIGYNTKNMVIHNLENDHHLQHASLAFYNSGFSEANVIVIDRNGSEWFDGARESETIFYASYPSNFSALYKSFWLYQNFAQEQLYDWSKHNNVEVDAKSLLGITKVYEAATTSINQNALENGKTMGLAAYGDRKKDFPRLFVNGTNIPNDFYFTHKMLGDMYQSAFHEPISDSEFSEYNYIEYADLAWQVQAQTQEAVAYLVSKSLEKSNTKNIVISGGYGLNVVANNYLIKSFPDINFYFEPLADDSGNCIGGAMLVYREYTRDMAIMPLEHTFFHGKEHDLSGIDGFTATSFDVANLIVQNHPVAVFNGRAESGPRALGNRSILFNAMNPDAKTLINIVKNREWYRPFALSVLESDAPEYFEMMGLKSSKFMTVSFDALNETKKLFPGVVHVDGSCRIQTVAESDGILYEVLKEIKKISGHGVVLNTSFNLAGQPLVDAPTDALDVLNNSELFAVWFPEINKIVY